MKNGNIKLQIGADGGNIKIVEYKSFYYIITNENIDEFVNNSKSKSYESFYEAFGDLQKKYPVFNLSPLFVDDDFKEDIACYFNEINDDPKFDSYTERDWKDILNPKNKFKTSFKLPNMKNKVVQHGGQTVNIREVKNIKLSQFTDDEKKNTIIIEFKTRLEYIYNPNIEEYELQTFNDVAEEVFPDWSTASAYFQEWMDVWQNYLNKLN